LISVTDQPEIR